MKTALEYYCLERFTSIAFVTTLALWTGVESDGDYFEVDEKGEIKLKHGKKKIDLSKLTHDDLRKLGIDPNLSKQEIARQLQVCAFLVFLTIG